jgi:hypothetical protein
MDAKEFEEIAREHPQIQALLQEVVDEVDSQIALVDTERLIFPGDEVLIGIAAYALFRWTKGYLDHRRALNEVEVLRQQQQVIAALIQDGFSPEQAQAVVAALLGNIARRSGDDPALKAAFALIGERE